MNALEALIGVIPMQLATTLKGVTPVLATLDTQGMDFLAQVSTGITKHIFPFNFITDVHQIITCSGNHGYHVILQLK